MKTREIVALLVAGLSAVSLCAAPAKKDSGVAAAEGVIKRFAGAEAQVELKLDTKGKKSGEGEERGGEWYKTELKGDKLVITGNSPIALTRGFYSATKAQKRGMNGWAGNRFAPGPWTKDAEEASGVRPH